MFYGTPHRASTFADWNDLTVNIAAVTLNTPKAVFSEGLKSSAQVLMDLSVEFLPFAGGCSILNVCGEGDEFMVSRPPPCVCLPFSPRKIVNRWLSRTNQDVIDV